MDQRDADEREARDLVQRPLHWLVDHDAAYLGQVHLDANGGHQVADWRVPVAPRSS